MMERVFSKEKINTGRQRELDFMKAYCIIMMIITHIIDDMFAGYSANLPSMIIDDVLAQTVGAQAFMISMGIGIIFSKTASVKLYVKRGVSLLITGQALNICRYVIPCTIACMIEPGDELTKAKMFLTFSSDILQFAAVFFLFMALFARLRLKPVHIFVLSVLMNLLGMLIGGRISTGSYAFDQLLGLFVFTETESYFPFIHWMIFPAFGMLFGEILQHVRDKKAFYGILLAPCFIIMGIYYYIAIFTEQNVFRFYTDWVTFCHPGLPDVLMQLFANTGILGLCYFLSAPLSDKVMKPVYYISKNINHFYCIHLVLIDFILMLMNELSNGEHPYFTTATGAYICAVCVIFLTFIIVMAGNSLFKKNSAKTSDGKGYIIYASIVVLISVVSCVWSYNGLTHYANMLNDYEF